ncbi:MAG: TatD family hydrolase [Parcubacteria group bacterium]|nr:TatD family hydrolase [Parcubacteria group bacterium]
MKPTLFDTHCHVNFNAFEDDGHDVVAKTLGMGVWMILVGSQRDTSRRAIEYAERYPEGVYAAVGLHPIHLTSITVDSAEIGSGAPGFTTRQEEFDAESYRALALNPRVVAIGECGLDYYRSPTADASGWEQAKKKQITVFRQHLDLAQEVGKPLMIHCRSDAKPGGREEAHEDLLSILEQYPFEDEPSPRGQIHFFSGTTEQAQRYIALGFLLSFTGVITFARDRDETIQEIPLDYVLIETDAPYVAPEPFRGKRNEPLHVEYVARKIAQIKGISFEDVAEKTTENALNLYKINKSEAKK